MKRKLKHTPSPEGQARLDEAARIRRLGKRLFAAASTVRQVARHAGGLQELLLAAAEVEAVRREALTL